MGGSDLLRRRNDPHRRRSGCRGPVPLPQLAVIIDAASPYGTIGLQEYTVRISPGNAFNLGRVPVASPGIEDVVAGKTFRLVYTCACKHENQCGANGPSSAFHHFSCLYEWCAILIYMERQYKTVEIPAGRQADHFQPFSGVMRVSADCFPLDG
jgi:hypothetical protein